MEWLKPWTASLGVLGASALGGALLHSVVLRRLQRWAETTETAMDDALVKTVVRPLPVWVLLGGVAAAAQAAPLAPRHAVVILKATVACFLLSVTVAASSLASLAVREYSRRLSGSARTVGVVDNLVRAVVLVIGGLLVLANLGVSIAPLLGALGVGSLAVALALQDTLTNLFAGLHILASRIVDVGDFIKLDSGQEGFVIDIGWRVTRIHDPSGNEIILPNSKLANAVVVNFDRPTADTGISVPLSVPYDADLERVERVAVEVGRVVQATVEGATRGFEPLVRFGSFEESSIRFAAILRSDKFPDRGLVIHEFLKAVHKRFAKEGIELQSPRRVLQLKS